ncbi:diguanylate cyclase [Paenibacillus glacialis]|uniref:Diguanylate cyclase n=2 Tax=Paenibacillus glacialis TaxID=494026 RepID=A0A168BX91_9BACL|nr:GGDEF domain-containing protein [Paenibacillus glacialis]OAB32853.1 diguanylate cyclase [Paenibacillus glacialis]
MSSSPWSSPILPGIAASIGLYIVLIMTVMCLIMYSKQRKKAYLYMVLAFLFIMTYEGMNIHFYLSHEKPEYSIWPARMQVFSFLILNVSVYLLYRKMNKKTNVILGLMLLLFLLPIFSPGLSLFHINSGQMLYLSLYQGLIAILGFCMISPRIGQRYKYNLGILIILIWAVMNLIYRYTDDCGTTFNSVRLFLPLMYYTVIFFILFERIVEQLQSIYRSSITDGLTNLYNRRFFMKNVNRYVDQGLKISVIFCDIDNFKKLNDTQGHGKADQVLQQVSAILEEEVSGVGLTGRYGGEELVAAIVDKRAKVNQIAENVRSRVEHETIVTISIGYSSLRKNVTADELVSQADQAMYRSKTTGKNKVSPFYTSSSKEPKQASS